ncbi:MAG TPA: hypothetical protein ENI27_00455 [bacterium]|nr:hypothetical protein [bacterium]
MKVGDYVTRTGGPFEGLLAQIISRENGEQLWLVEYLSADVEGYFPEPNRYPGFSLRVLSDSEIVLKRLNGTEAILRKLKINRR